MDNNLLLKQIEKSIFDTNINVGSSNPRLLTNENKKIQTEIMDGFKWCKRFDIAVSYVLLSGLQRLIENMENKDGSRFLTTIDGYVTTPEALKVLLNIPGVETRVFVPKRKTVGFHAKTYMFHNETNQRIMVGSANISNRAFGSVHETSLMVDIENKGELYKRYQNNFNDIWNVSQELTKEFIDEYQKIFELYKKATHDPLFWINKSNGIKPNMMQKDALEQLALTRENGYKKALVIASTGSGKTYLSAFDVKQVNPNKVLFLVHNRTILRKAMESFKNVFKNFSGLELKTSNIKHANKFKYIFTTPQTLSKNIKLFSEDHFDYIILDEAHHTPAPQYQKILNHFNPSFLLGMTATPDRPDSKINAKDVYAQYEHIIPYEIRLHDSIEEGLIAPFNYFGIGEDLANENVKPKDKVEAIKQVLKKYGHFGNKLKALAFVDTIKAAEELAESLTNSGIESIAVSGSTANDDVDMFLEELGNEEASLKIIVSVNKLNEGIDVPEINTIFMLRKTQSSIIYIQQLGRGLRLSDPNKFVSVFDFVGNYAGSFGAIQGILDEHDATSSRLKRTLLSKDNLLSNIQLDEIARKRIYDSIDNGMKGTKTILKTEFKKWVEKYGYVPSMIEYEQSTNKIEEILLNFDSFQELKLIYNYTQLSKKGEDFFRHISQFIIHAGTKEQIKQTLDLLKGNEVIIRDDYFKRYLLSQFKNIVMNRNKGENAFFREVSLDAIKLNIDDLLKDGKFKKEFDELIEYISKNESGHNNSLVLHRNYRRLAIPFMAKRASLANLLEGQFKINNEFWCLPSLSKIGSENEVKYGNRLIDRTKIMYITKDDTKSVELASGKYSPHFFIRHRDSKDTYLTYIGRGTLISNEGKWVKEDNKNSLKLIFKLENEVPQWMIDDYTEV